MYAVVNTGGKQAKVETGAIIAVEKLTAEVGETVILPVIFIADGDRILATAAELEGAGAKAEVLEHFKGEKQIVFKFKKRKGYKRTRGHRQSLTSVRILEIASSGMAAPKAKPAAEKKAAAPKPAAEKKAAAPKATAKPAVKPAAEKKAAAPKATAKPAVKPAAEKKPAAPKAASKPAKVAPVESAAATAQCEAVKSDGSRCANKAKEGSKYCGVHAKKLEG